MNPLQEPGQAAAGRIGEVSTEVERLSSMIKQLDSSVEELFQRLGVVLRSPPEKEEDAGSPREALVPLADSIRNETDQLSKSVIRLNKLSSQIEL